MARKRIGEPSTSRRRIEAVEKQAEALRLRKAGASYADIAARLGYSSKAGAFKAVSTALTKTLREPAEELRLLEADRLDALQEALWAAAMAGKWLAVDRILAIMERRAKLLNLDKKDKGDAAAGDDDPLAALNEAIRQSVEALTQAD